MNKSVSLSPHHFYLRGFKREELPIVCRYEYFRSSQPMCEAISKIRALFPLAISVQKAMGPLNPHQMAHNDELFAAMSPPYYAAGLVVTFYYHYFGGIDDFPEMPWMDVKAKDRRDYLVDAQPPKADEVPLTNGKAIERLRGGPWIGMIEKDAVKYVRSVYRSVNPRRHGGSGGPSDQLNNLSVWRLLDEAGLSMTEAQIEWRKIERIKRLPNKYPYRNEEDWYDGKNKAASRLQGLDEHGKRLQIVLHKMQGVLEYADACLALKRRTKRRMPLTPVTRFPQENGLSTIS